MGHRRVVLGICFRHLPHSCRNPFRRRTLLHLWRTWSGVSIATADSAVTQPPKPISSRALRTSAQGRFIPFRRDLGPLVLGRPVAFDVAFHASGGRTPGSTRLWPYSNGSRCRSTSRPTGMPMAVDDLMNRSGVFPAPCRGRTSSCSRRSDHDSICPSGPGHRQQLLISCRARSSISSAGPSSPRPRRSGRPLPRRM